MSTLGTIVALVMVYLSPIFATESNIWGIFFFCYFCVMFLLMAAPWVMLFEGGADEGMLISFYIGMIIWGIPVFFSSSEVFLPMHMAVIIGGVGISINGLIYTIKLIIKKKYRCASA